MASGVFRAAGICVSGAFRVQGALSNYGYRWGWFGIACLFQVLIVAGLVSTGAARLGGGGGVGAWEAKPC